MISPSGTAQPTAAATPTAATPTAATAAAADSMLRHRRHTLAEAGASPPRRDRADRPAVSPRGLLPRSSSENNADINNSNHGGPLLQPPGTPATPAAPPTPATPLQPKARPSLRLDNQTLLYVDDAGSSGRIHLDDVCAVTVTLYTDISRPEVNGQVMVVPKAKSLSRSEWAAWVHMLLLNVSMYIFLARVLGPVTALAMLAISILGRADIDAYLTKEYELTADGLRLGKTVIGLLACASNAIVFTSTWKSAAAVLAVFGLLPFVAREWTIGLFLLPSTFRYISPTYPILVSYPQQGDVPALLEFRQQIKANSLASPKLHHLAVGSFWAETVLSVLLYHDIYNSIRLRRAMLFFLTYVLPVIYTFQIFYVFGPRIAAVQRRLVASVQADYGVLVVRSLAYFIKATNILPGPPQFILDAISAVRTAIQAASSWTAYFSAWVVPVDEAITYFRVKFEPLRLLVVQMAVAVAPLAQMLVALARLVATSLAPVVQNASSMMKVLIMPLITVVANASRVITLTATRPVHEVRAFYARVAAFRLWRSAEEEAAAREEAAREEAAREEDDSERSQQGVDEGEEAEEENVVRRRRQSNEDEDGQDAINRNEQRDAATKSPEDFLDAEEPEEQEAEQESSNEKSAVVRAAAAAAFAAEEPDFTAEPDSSPVTKEVPVRV